jgi:hypothetical protein
MGRIMPKANGTRIAARQVGAPRNQVVIGATICIQSHKSNSYDICFSVA